MLVSGFGGISGAELTESGMPTLAPSFLSPETKVWIQSENGLLGMVSFYGSMSWPQLTKPRDHTPRKRRLMRKDEVPNH